MNRKLKISEAVALVLAGLPLPVFAQSGDATTDAAATNGDELSEITVTGYRASLRDAIEVKKATVGIVEAISSKDIGVLPDVTIAETLARLPGINTVRDRGNDSQAAIRGLGPRMVLGLINGREMASSEPDRNVRWEVFPSEIVSGAEVYKSSQADLDSGGISGTVDIQTIRPLDYKGPALYFRAGPAYYEGGGNLPDYDQTGYRASGAYVTEFTPNVGFVISASLQKQRNGYESIGGGGWNNLAPGAVEPGGPLVESPWGASIDEKAIDTNRASVATSLQWRAADSFEGRIDLLGSRVKLSERDDGGWFTDWGNWGGYNTGTPGAEGYNNNVVVGDSLVATDMTFDSTYHPYVSLYKQGMDLVATGFNGKWSLDQWTLVTDIAYSQAERSGIWQAVEMYNNAGPASYDYSGRLPIVEVGTDAWQAANAGQLFPNTGQAAVSRLRDTMKNAQVDAERALEGGFLSAFKFGVRYTDRAKEDAEPGTVANVDPLDWAAPVPVNMLRPWKYQYFTAPTFVSGDFNELAVALYGEAGLDSLNADYKNTPFVSKVEEKVTEAYVMAKYATQLGSVSVDGNFGVRAVKVDQSSFGPSNGTDITVDQDYTKYLPSLTGRLDFGDGNFLKFGLSRALSRPPLNDLRVDRAFSTLPPYTGGGGNPDLKPYVADQIDISYEKYFRDDGLFAIAGFAKRIKNYIGFDTRTLLIPGFDQPVTYTSPFNSEDTGTLKGIELSYQTPFYFIPHMENFGVYSNLALTDSDIHENSPASNPLPMNGVAKRTAILDFWYAGSKFDARVGLKYHTDYTLLFTWSSSGLQTVKAETMLDFSAGYKFSDHVSLRFQAGNLLNTPLRLFDNNNENQIARNDVYGRHYLMDVTFKY